MILPHDAWDELRSAGKGDGHLEIASLSSSVQTGFGPIRFSLGSEEQARVLVPCGSAHVRVSAESTDNLKLRVVEYRGSDGRHAYLDLMCPDSNLEMVFSELASEIMRRVQAGITPVKAVSGAIGDFKALFMSTPPLDISRERILGLVGELYILNRLAEFDSAAAGIWVGPWDQRHDFRSRLCALEVKTSGRSDSSKVRVHGVDQLLPPAGGELVLIQVRLEEGRGGSVSVGKLYKSLIEQLYPAHRLDEGLASLGCDDPFSTTWNRYEFSLEGLNGWQVRDGFPRLTAREMSAKIFPTGVESLEYTLDLSGADSFLMEPEDLENYIKKMSHEQA